MADFPGHQDFSQPGNQKQWISGLRNLYRYLPFARSTYRNAAAIIAASSQVCSEFAAYRDKLFFVPEPGSQLPCVRGPRSPEPGAKLELIFVGGLVPRKACDLALRAARSPFAEAIWRSFTVVGDGPERSRFEQLMRSLGIENCRHSCGWVSHAEVLSRLRSADVLVFPSVRDMARAWFSKLSDWRRPVVADFGGPGDIVHPEVGFKVPLTNESDFVAQMEKILTELAHDRNRLERLRQQGMAYVRECLTWDAKARSTARILKWAVKQGPKPDFPPPKRPQPVSIGGS